MSDVDPDLPDYLVDAILSQGPPPGDVDLVKNAFAWRTIDAELMELSYDSVLDEAGVRDASARRTMEFTLGELRLVIEIDGVIIRGTIVPAVEASVWLAIGGDQRLDAAVSDGSFRLESPVAGPVWIEIAVGDTMVATAAFVIG